MVAIRIEYECVCVVDTMAESTQLDDHPSYGRRTVSGLSQGVGNVTEGLQDANKAVKRSFWR